MTEHETNRPISSWSELFSRSLELGLGAASLTVETAQKVVKDLVHRGQVTEEEGESLVDRLLALGREQRQQIEQMVNKGVEHTMERMDLARRSEVEVLRARVAELELTLLGRGPSDAPIPPVHEAEHTDIE